jgi:hypothetical protein
MQQRATKEVVLDDGRLARVARSGLAVATTRRARCVGPPYQYATIQQTLGQSRVLQVAVAVGGETRVATATRGSRDGRYHNWPT